MPVPHPVGIARSAANLSGNGGCIQGWFIVLALLACATCVQGQDKPPPPTEPNQLEEVIITGSRIARPDLDRLEPTTTVDAAMFDNRGYTDIGQALNELPGFGVQPSSSANVQSPYGIGQSFVDLYSLGSQRTLTLVNGRRFVSSNTASLFGGAVSPGQQVDLNVIPTKLIDRVETISVGGAPIYGADAISGTVNIILKKNYHGLDVDAQSGISDQGDAFNWRVRALGGMSFAEGRGNITGVAEFTRSNGLVGTERKNYDQNLGFVAPLTPGPYKTVLTADQAVSSISTSGVPYVDDSIYLPGSPYSSIGITNAQGQPLAFAPGSSALQPYNPGRATGNPIFWQGGDGIRLSQFTNLLATTEHINTDFLSNFALTGHVSLFAEGWFSDCLAAGIDPDNFTSNVVNATAQGITSGNTGLQSETADARTYGFVLQPRWVPRLSLSADYIDIRMANAIEQLNLEEILDACYDSPDYPNNASCKQFTRNPSGQITSYHDGFVNAGLLHFQGVSATLDYTATLPFNWGSLQSRINYLDTRILVLQVGSAAPVNEAGELAAFSNNGAAPKGRGTISFNYLKGPFSWFWQGQYYSGMNFNNLNAANQQNILRVNPWWLINSTVSCDVTHAVNVRLVINNVFNKEPPYPALAGTGGNFASAASLYFPGIIGRTYLLAVDVHLF